MSVAGWKISVHNTGFTGPATVSAKLKWCGMAPNALIALDLPCRARLRWDSDGSTDAASAPRRKVCMARAFNSSRLRDWMFIAAGTDQAAPGVGQRWCWFIGAIAAGYHRATDCFIAQNYSKASSGEAEHFRIPAPKARRFLP